MILKYMLRLRGGSAPTAGGAHFPKQSSADALAEFEGSFHERTEINLSNILFDPHDSTLMGLLHASANGAGRIESLSFK